MSNKSVRTRMIDALKDNSVTSEQLSSVEKILRENMTNAGDQTVKSLLTFVALSTAWILIKFSYIQNIKLLDIEISNSAIALLILPPIAAFAFYQYQCYMLLADVSYVAVEALYQEKFKPFAEQNLEALLSYPTFIGIENTVRNLTDTKGFLGKTSLVWLSILMLVITFVPIIFLVWVCYSLISFPILSIGWSITSSVFVLLFVLRTLMIFVHWLSHY